MATSGRLADPCAGSCRDAGVALADGLDAVVEILHAALVQKKSAFDELADKPDTRDAELIGTALRRAAARGDTAPDRSRAQRVDGETEADFREALAWRAPGPGVLAASVAGSALLGAAAYVLAEVWLDGLVPLVSGLATAGACATYAWSRLVERMSRARALRPAAVIVGAALLWLVVALISG